LDWYLTRAELQRRLGKFEAAAAGLKQAFDRTGSAVFEVEWIDAMIDAGQYAQAIERIEPRLAECAARAPGSCAARACGWPGANGRS
jgi:hypothetical protein